MKYIWILFLIILLTGYYGCKNSPRENVADNLNSDNMEDKEDHNHIEFGFANEKGDQVLMLKKDTLINPMEFSTVVFNSEEIVKIEFIKYQPTNSADDGRHLSDNFKNCEGYLFKLDSGTVKSDQTVILLTSSFLNNKDIRNFIEVEKAILPDSILSKIAKEKNRDIKHYKSIIEIDENELIYLIEFEPIEDSLLVSLALIDTSGITFKDFPAQYDEVSAWRVDDGGEFGFDNFKVLAVFDKDGKFELVTEWLGTEGNAIEYIVQEGVKFKTLKEAYRYTAPL